MQAKQSQLIQMFFKRGDFVRYVKIQFNGLHGAPTTRICHAAVETECSGRPGWYYVREHASGECDLVLWSDLELIA